MADDPSEAPTAAGRSGTTRVHSLDGKWVVEVQLKEGEREHTVVLTRAFSTEALACSAGERTVGEWRESRLAMRDLMLAELAAVYRRLRTKHTPMQPSAVPATRSAWEQAIAAWEQLEWIPSPDALRYREHVDVAFDVQPERVRRHRLSSDDSPP